MAALTGGRAVAVCLEAKAPPLPHLSACTKFTNTYKTIAVIAHLFRNIAETKSTMNSLHTRKQKHHSGIYFGSFLLQSVHLSCFAKCEHIISLLEFWIFVAPITNNTDPFPTKRRWKKREETPKEEETEESGVTFWVTSSTSDIIAVPLLSKQALPVSYRLKSAQRGRSERWNISLHDTLMSGWTKSGTTEEEGWKEIIKHFYFFKQPKSRFLFYFLPLSKGHRDDLDMSWPLMADDSRPYTMNSTIVDYHHDDTNTSVVSTQSFLFSSVSLLSITPSNTWMIHWEKNESTCGDTSNLSDWHDCVSLNQTQEPWVRRQTGR